MSFTLSSARSRVASLVAFAVTISSLALAGGIAASATPAAASTPAVYDVALGDSLAAGTGASVPANDYVNLIYQHESGRITDLQVQNLACPGATTASMISGPSCGSGTQLGNAEAFLAAHPGQVSFVTIDIGANDILGCVQGTTLDPTCATNVLQTIDTNLTQILSGLEAAYPGIQVFGMNYYDPVLAAWLTGAAGQTAAQQSAVILTQFNTELAQIYASAGFPTADVASTFQSQDFDLTGSFDNQTLPQNVANICNWTHMCVLGDIHANDTGHAAIASTFDPMIDSTIPASPGLAITSADSATAVVGTPFSFTVTTSGPSAPVIKASRLPMGLRLVSNGNGTATISGIPAAYDDGTYAVTITASVTKLPAVTQSFVLTVDNEPVFRSKSRDTAHTGTAISYSVITLHGYPVPTITTTSTLPAGVTLTDNGNGTATLGGTPGPAAGGMYPITFTATNGIVAPVTQMFNLTVDQAPVITSAGSDAVTAGSAMTPFTVTDTGFPLPTLRASGLPAGVKLTDNKNFTGTIAGTPKIAAAGNHTVTITASGRAGSTTQTFSLTVDP